MQSPHPVHAASSSASGAAPGGRSTGKRRCGWRRCSTRVPRNPPRSQARRDRVSLIGRALHHRPFRVSPLKHDTECNPPDLGALSGAPRGPTHRDMMHTFHASRSHAASAVAYPSWPVFHLRSGSSSPKRRCRPRALPEAGGSHSAHDIECSSGRAGEASAGRVVRR